MNNDENDDLVVNLCIVAIAIGVLGLLAVLAFSIGIL